MATADNFQFRLHRIDAIHHVVVWRKVDFVGIFGQIEQRKFPHFAVGVDVADALFHHIDFQPSDGGMKGDNLAVEVREVHAVGIDHRNRPNTAPRQHLDDVAANATHAENDHARRTQPFHCLLTQQKFSSRELGFHQGSIVNYQLSIVNYLINSTDRFKKASSAAPFSIPFCSSARSIN